MLKGIISYAHYLLKNTVQKGDIVVDATCGNGNDTLLLSKLVGETGHVYAFDIQKQAIETTEQLMKENNCSNVSLILDSHAKVDLYLPEQKKVAGAIFNLGYLPRSNKQVITKASSTIVAIEKLLERLKKNAVLVIVIYYGHEGGLEEKNAVITFAKQLSQQHFSVLKYQFINQINQPPFVVAIEKR